MMNTAIHTGHDRTFLPAAGHDLLLPLYDWITRLIGADRARSVLVRQAALAPGQRALDVGCGTGTLAVLLRQVHPQVEIAGLDPDPRALERAARKARRAAVPVRFDRGFADSLPYGDGHFDAVFSSFMFHHLDLRTRERMLLEVRRVLKPGGRLYLLDFGGPDSAAGNPLSRWFHRHRRLAGNSETTVLSLMTSAGLADCAVAGRGTVLFGLARVVYYQAA